MTTATRQVKTRLDLIDPIQWRVVGQLRHGETTYGTAEPLPAITLAEAELYEKQGVLMRVTDTSLAEAYLEGPDAVVLQTILGHRRAARAQGRV